MPFNIREDKEFTKKMPQINSHLQYMSFVVEEMKKELRVTNSRLKEINITFFY